MSVSMFQRDSSEKICHECGQHHPIQAECPEGVKGMMVLVKMAP
jgi:primosomal protein N'